MLEKGWANKFLEVRDLYFERDFPSKRAIYFSAKEYVDANTFEVKNLSFQKIEALFYLYGLLIFLFSSLNLFIYALQKV